MDRVKKGLPAYYPVLCHSEERHSYEDASMQ